MVEVRSGRAARAQVGSQIERYLTRRTPMQVVAELVLLHPRGGERTLAVGLETRAYRRGIERSPQRLLVGRLEEHRVLRRPQDERGHAQLLQALDVVVLVQPAGSAEPGTDRRVQCLWQDLREERRIGNGVGDPVRAHP